jgi:hypothetical protein
VEAVDVFEDQRDDDDREDDGGGFHGKGEEKRGAAGVRNS